ncbi:MAG: hypothetical protein WBC54_09105 [Rhodococcus sp. (in: high G+C Gram-positive bacteria)]
MSAADVAPAVLARALWPYRIPAEGREPEKRPLDDVSAGRR